MSNESIDFRDLMLWQYDLPTFAACIRGEMENPFRPRPVVDRIKARTVFGPAEAAVIDCGASILEPPINPKTGSPYGRDTQAVAAYLAKLGVNPDLAVFQPELDGILDFERACRPKVEGVKAEPLVESRDPFKRVIGRPPAYRLPRRGGGHVVVAVETTSNWVVGSVMEFPGANDTARVRCHTAVAMLALEHPGDDVAVLLAETCRPYRACLGRGLAGRNTALLPENYDRAVAEILAGGMPRGDEWWPVDL